MDPLHLSVALGPLAAYLLLLGMINRSRRPFLTTGGRDKAALCLAICGFVIVGPMELFMPSAAVVQFGGYVWLMLLALYALLVTVWVLTARPRLVIYNITPDQLRPILAELVADLDNEARWAGDSLMLPQLGVQLHVESFPAVRNVQLVSSGPQQSYGGWRRLERALDSPLREFTGTRNPYGLSLILFGSFLIAMIGFWILTERQAMAQALVEMLRL